MQGGDGSRFDRERELIIKFGGDANQPPATPTDNPVISDQGKPVEPGHRNMMNKSDRESASHTRRRALLALASILLEPPRQAGEVGVARNLQRRK